MSLERLDDLDDEELLSTDLSELAARCPTVASRYAVLERLQSIAAKADSFPAPSGTLAYEMIRHRQCLPLLWARDHCHGFRWAVDCLVALGEAIATVARARLVSRVSDGRTIAVKLADGSVLDLGASTHGAALRSYASVEARFCLDGRTLREFDGVPEDFAAEAVARLIEEASK